ncbi:hypothetical protein FO519_000077 [Halicephalobus sp. NKZ332]|nr:hypothetical protein FO519_000077 [Halicephalobus sp. NKZ332]
MKITCITSLVKKDISQEEHLHYLIEQSNFENQLSFEEVLESNKKLRRYCVSDLYVGYTTDSMKMNGGLWFNPQNLDHSMKAQKQITQDVKNKLTRILLHRRGTGEEREILLEPGSVKISIEDERLIVLKIKSPDYSIDEIRIRFIRAKSTKYMSEDEENIYSNLCKEIEDYAQEDPEKRENCPLLQQEFPGSERLTEKKRKNESKARNGKISDLKFAINYLCQNEEYPELNLTYINNRLQRIQSLLIIAKNKRRMTFEPKKSTNYKSHYDDKTVPQSFTECEKLKINGVPLNDFHRRWFDAIYLTSLSLVNLTFFVNMDLDSWKQFSNGLSKLKCLQKFVLKSNKIKSIPSIVLKSLPSDKIVHLDFNNNDLTTLPKEISKFKKLKTLKLAKNYNFLGDDEFWKYLPKSLCYFVMSDTGVKKIPPEIREFNHFDVVLFENCKNLEFVSWEDLPLCSFSTGGNINSPPPTVVLKLPKNDIQEILYEYSDVNWPDFDFTYLPLNTTYFLFQNSTVTPSKVIKRLENLVKIQFLNCNLKEFDFYHIPANLDILQLDGNLITEITFPTDEQWYWVSIEEEMIHIIQEFHCPSTVIHGVNVEEKDKILKAAYGDVIPPDDGINEFSVKHLLLIKRTKPNITSLYLSGNRIFKFGQNSGFFESLSTLNLDHNELESLPEDIDGLVNLEKLYLGYNKLKSLPKTLWKLSYLKVLDVQNNLFTNENDLVEDLWKYLPESLRSINVSNNPIQVLPCCLKDFELMRIHAVNCKLKWICPKLRHCFFLDGNKDLTNLPFLPSTPYDPSSANLVNGHVNNYNSKKLKKNTPMIVIFDNEFLSVESIPTKSRKPNLLFNECEIQNACCKCCANLNCKNKNDVNKKFVEQVLVMDFAFQSKQHIKEISIDHNSDDFIKCILEPGKWKSKVQTTLCESCIPEVKERLENVTVAGSEKRSERYRKRKNQNGGEKKEKPKKPKKPKEEFSQSQGYNNQQFSYLNQEAHDSQINAYQFPPIQCLDPEVPGPSGFHSYPKYGPQPMNQPYIQEYPQSVYQPTLPQNLQPLPPQGPYFVDQTFFPQNPEPVNHQPPPQGPDFVDQALFTQSSQPINQFHPDYQLVHQQVPYFENNPSALSEPPFHQGNFYNEQLGESYQNVYFVNECYEYPLEKY